MMSLDAFSVVGIVAAGLVVVMLIILCKIRGCNKPIC